MMGLPLNNPCFIFGANQYNISYEILLFLLNFGMITLRRVLDFTIYRAYGDFHINILYTFLSHLDIDLYVYG